MKTFLTPILIAIRLVLLAVWLAWVVFWAWKPETRTVETVGYREPPRKPRMLASGMNWQNKFKKHLTNSKYDSIL